MKNITLTAAFVACFLILSCSPPAGQFYEDSFYREDNIYENKPLGFLLTYEGNWNIVTDPEKMDRNSRLFANELRKAGLELLYVGTTVEGYLGTRAIGVNLNEPSADYAEYVRRLNKDDVENDKGLVQFYAGDNPMIKWEYEKSGFCFVEFFINVGTYDIRIAFWTKPDLYKNFLPVFEEIISTLTITGSQI